ncbi:MAG: hypothetical protein LBT23_10320 [Synergistaceae bacterium]|jgi:hypothetical protein|nr:hypothetical protein [Synergistaceae bacterium]
MTTQTEELSPATTTQSLFRGISELSDEGLRKLAEYVRRLNEEQEIAALEAKYGTTPNVETIAAIEELRAGKGKRFNNIDELMANLLDENDD